MGGSRGHNVSSLRPIEQYTAGAPDSTCARDTSTATDHDHAQNTRERARVSSINKDDVPDGLQIIREALEVQGIF